MKARGRRGANCERKKGKKSFDLLLLVFDVHKKMIAEDNTFGPPQGAWFTMMEDNNHLVHLDLNSTHSNFSKNAFFST